LRRKEIPCGGRNASRDWTSSSLNAAVPYSRRRAYERVVQSNMRGEALTYHLHVVIELSDYGTPVQVETPTDLAPSK
jgi:hypothetical protein